MKDASTYLHTELKCTIENVRKAFAGRAWWACWSIHSTYLFTFCFTMWSNFNWSSIEFRGKQISLLPPIMEERILNLSSNSGRFSGGVSLKLLDKLVGEILWRMPKSVHFKNTVTGSSFHSKPWPFSNISWHQNKVCWCIIKNGHSFEWNEGCITVFLKWTDFS